MTSEPFRIGTGEAVLASAEIIALIAIALAFGAGRLDAKTEQKEPKSFRNGVAFRPWHKHEN